MRLPYPVKTPAIAEAAPPSTPDTTRDTRLTDRWLLIARVVWVVVALLTIAVFIGGTIAAFAHVGAVCPTPACDQAQIVPAVRQALRDAGLSYGFLVVYSAVLAVAFALVYGGVALIIFWRRSNDGMALLTSLALLTFGLATFSPMAEALAESLPATRPLVASLRLLGSISFFGFLYVFPTGRFTPRWSRWIALIWAIQQVFHIALPGSPADTSSWPLPPQLLIWCAFLGSVIYAQIYRYRRVSSPTQRVQTKWVVYGVSVAFLVYLAIQATLVAIIRDLSTLTVDGLRASFAGTLVIYGGMVLIPLSIAIAMLRYRLFNVDTLISRTLVYGALTICVLAVYVLVVGAFALAFQVRGNPAVSLLATGVVAIAFQPLRERLQRGANRLVYGRRDEPYAVLSQLGRRLEATLAPDAVLPVIVETVAQALKLPYAAVALKQGDQLVTAATYGTLSGDPLTIPLVFQAESVGQIVLAPRSLGEGWTSADQRLLNDLAYQAGIAAHAVLLTAELRRARERLVLAREEERRRLRRDLHDGLGPQLASQTLVLAAATRLLRQDPAAAETLLGEAMRHAQEAVADIRRVVYALRPPALDDLGLVAALREQAERFSGGDLHVTVEAPPDLPPLPAAVEVACYRIAQEALANVAHHAVARTCRLVLTVSDALRLEVQDDGKGIAADHRAGVGLSSMRERAEELGGTCSITPALAGGTSVYARLPLS